MGSRRSFVFFLLLALLASACSSAADQVAEEVVAPTSTTTTSAPPEPEFAGTTIVVGVPPDLPPGMQDIIALTPEFFTSPTGIEVDIVVLPEQKLRERAVSTLSLIHI